MKIEYRHSASKTNTFIDSPAFWIINNLYDFDSQPNARMKMGSVAEETAEYALQNQITDEEVIIDYAKSKYIELKGDESDDECLWSGIIANQFVKELPQFGKVISYQKSLQIPGDKYGLKYDVIGKTDFEFDDVIIDTKATAYIKRLKSGAVDSKWYPKDADLRQQALYKDLFNKPTALLYCSYKDVHSVDMEGREGHLEVILQAMKNIEHCLKLAKTKEDVVKMFPLVTDYMGNFRWKGSPGSIEYAKLIWQEAFE
jgi:hypothetical protein